MKRVAVFAVIFIFAIYGSIFSDESMTAVLPQTSSNEKKDEETPQFLYKVLSAKDWEESQKMKIVKLSSADSEFIHLSKFDQLDRVLSKYWADVPEFVVLKIDAKKLVGNLVFEVNPGGVHKYYHLYSGSIPIEAVVDAKVFKSSGATPSQ